MSKVCEEKNFKVNLSYVFFQINAGIGHYKLIKSELGDNCMIDLIKKEMGEIVLAMLNLAHDSNQWFEEDLVFPASKRFFEQNVVKKSIEMMHTIFFVVSFFFFVLSCECKKCFLVDITAA